MVMVWVSEVGWIRVLVPKRWIMIPGIQQHLNNLESKLSDAVEADNG